MFRARDHGPTYDGDPNSRITITTTAGEQVGFIRVPARHAAALAATINAPALHAADWPDPVDGELAAVEAEQDRVAAAEIAGQQL